MAHSSSSFVPLVVLNGTNVQEWSFHVKLVLQSQGLRTHVDESLPDARGQTEIWKKNDANAMKIIVDRINSEQLYFVMSKTNAKEMMDEFTRLYGTGNTLTKLFILDEN